MTYLVAYLALGAIALAVALISHRWAHPPQSDFTREMFEAIDPERATLRYKLVHRLVVPALAGLLMLVGWPVAVFIKVRELVAPRPAEEEPEPAEFCVAREHLLREMSVEEIEATEMVNDPLGAVPPLPFGHLNAPWSRFKAGLAADDRIWHFLAPWEEGWGRAEVREGYVVVRTDSVGPHFVTAIRIADDEEASEPEGSP